MKKIAITTTSFCQYDERPVELLRGGGFEIIVNPYGRKLKRDEIRKLCKEVVGIIAGTEILDAGIMENLRDLKVISRCGTGLDNVDLNVAGSLGIKVLNTPDAPTLAVAELTVGMALTLLRKIHAMDGMIRKGAWGKKMGNLLSEKKAGIIGYGRIGKKVAELLRAFRCEIAYADPIALECPLGSKCMPVDDLLRWADILFCHVSVKDRLIGKREIDLMKDGAWIINVSRGGVIDEHALYEALRSGKLSGAALDVFEDEPYAGPLRELDNVVLTPHVGSYAREARIRMEMQAVENLLTFLKKEDPCPKE